MAIELLVGQTPEVTNTGQGHGQQPVQEFPHAVAAQGHAGADGHAFTKLEVSNGLLGAPQFGLLAGNQGQVFQGAIDELGVAGSSTDTHVHDNLDHTRNLHDVVVVEFVIEFGADFFTVPGL